MNANGQGLEEISVRRAKMADAGKVRYRVYSTPTEFIAVIAESALMAVKVAGVPDPLRIIRDLPTEGITLAAERIAREEAFEMVAFARQPKPRGEFKAELVKSATPEGDFVPLKLRDLQSRSDLKARIITAEALNALLEKMPPKPEAMAMVMPPPDVAVQAPPGFAPPGPLAPSRAGVSGGSSRNVQPGTSPISSGMRVGTGSPAASPAAPSPATPPEKAKSPRFEMPEATGPNPDPVNPEVLSPEEVEKLLNG